jgi:hypothetical protein
MFLCSVPIKDMHYNKYFKNLEYIPAKTQKTENSNLHRFELHRPSSKDTKLLFLVIKASSIKDIRMTLQYEECISTCSSFSTLSRVNWTRGRSHRELGKPSFWKYLYCPIGSIKSVPACWTSLKIEIEICQKKNLKIDVSSPFVAEVCLPWYLWHIKVGWRYLHRLCGHHPGMLPYPTCWWYKLCLIAINTNMMY